MRSELEFESLGWGLHRGFGVGLATGLRLLERGRAWPWTQLGLEQGVHQSLGLRSVGGVKVQLERARSLDHVFEHVICILAGERGRRHEAVVGE